MLRRLFLSRTGLVILGAAFASPVRAGGFSLEHQNAAALGAAFAGAEAATADPGFAAYNPAAIAGTDRFDVNLNVTSIWPQSRYDGATGTLLGATPVSGRSADAGVIDNAVVPNLSLAFPASDRLTLGLVANATYGFATDFSADSVVRYQARKSDLRAIEISPVASFAVAPGLNIGAALRVQSLDLSVTSTIDAGGIAAANLIPGFAPGSGDLGAAFEGSNWAVGYSVGLNSELTPRLRAGAFFASKINHDIEGDAAFDLAESAAAQILNAVAGLFAADRFSAALATPGSAGAGVRYAATERLTLLASAKIIFWSSFDEARFVFNDGATPPEVLVQNWRDSWSGSLGAEYRVSDKTALRAGVMIDESPVNGAFASPRIPDGDRHWVAAGVSQALSENMSADLGVAYAFFSHRTIDISGAAPEDLFRGALRADFKTEAYAVSLRFRRKF